MRRAGVYASVLAGVVVVAGCGGDGGEAVPETSVVATAAPSSSVDPDAGVWDPCSLPESAISATGLDPATKAMNVGGVDFDGWQVCSWRGVTNWYNLTLLSGRPTLDEIRRRTDFTSFSDRAVGGHAGVMFLDIDDPRRLTCTIAVEVPGGTVAFRLLARPTVEKQGDPCATAGEHADDLAAQLPTE